MDDNTAEINPLKPEEKNISELPDKEINEEIKAEEKKEQLPSVESMSGKTKLLYERKNEQGRMIISSIYNLLGISDSAPKAIESYLQTTRTENKPPEIDTIDSLIIQSRNYDIDLQKIDEGILPETYKSNVLSHEKNLVKKIGLYFNLNNPKEKDIHLETAKLDFEAKQKETKTRLTEMIIGLQPENESQLRDRDIQIAHTVCQGLEGDVVEKNLTENLAYQRRLENSRHQKERSEQILKHLLEKYDQETMANDPTLSWVKRSLELQIQTNGGNHEDFAQISHRLTDMIQFQINSKFKELVDNFDSQDSDHVSIYLNTEIIPDINSLEERLSSNVSTEENARHLRFLIQKTESHNMEIGQTEELFFHNNARDDVFYSILENGILSHREGIKNGLKIEFVTGSGAVNYSLDSTGINYAGRHFSWEEVPEKMSEIQSSKSWTTELDQVLFNQDRPYHSGEWSVVFPSREIRSRHQYSADYDGIHVFDAEYSDDNYLEELKTKRFNPETKGSHIRLEQYHFLIALTESGLNNFLPYFQENFDRLPGHESVSSLEEWINKYTITVDNIRDQKDISKIREAMFSRFDIEKTEGTEISTGNVATSTANEFVTKKYIHS